MSLVKQIHEVFWENNNYYYIFIFSLFYILLFKRNEKRAWGALGIYSLIALVMIIYNPIIGYFFDNVLHEDVLALVRVFYVLPVFAVMAAALTYLLYAVNGERQLQTRVALFLIYMVLIISAGETFRSAGLYSIPENPYKINQEAVLVAKALEEDQGGTDDIQILVDLEGAEDFLAAQNVGRTERRMMTSLNQFCSRIKALDAFRGEEVFAEFGEAGLQNYLAETMEIPYSYIVTAKNERLGEICEKYGMERLLFTENYMVLKRVSDSLYVDSTDVCCQPIQVEGLTEDVNIVVINDLHLNAIDDPQVLEDCCNDINNRHLDYSVDENGVPSAENWPRIVEKINEQKPDLVVLAGDMVDYTSQTTIDTLKQGLDKINAPIMYVRSDHDYDNVWTNLSTEEVFALQNSVTECQDIYEYEFPELIVMGIDSSYKNISTESLEKVKEILSKGKPVYVITHVPFDSPKDPNFSNIVLERRERRILWGENDYYVPDENQRELINLLFGEESPVVGVAAAHLHFDYEASMNEKVSERIFPPAFMNSIGYVAISGK